MDRVGSCLLCCETCIRNGVGNEHDESAQDPFSLDNLLSAGTITVDVHDYHLPCVHIHANDAWHPVPFRQLSIYPEDDVFRMISFLTEHRFLRATCCLGTSRALYIRIYIIPTDLPNVQGILRRRSKAVLKEGVHYLQLLLPMIVQSGHEHHSFNRQNQRYLLPRDTVSTP